MIQLIRVDDRLLHGQVAYSWKGALGYQAIVIANDNAFNDEIRKQVLRAARPQGVRITIRDLEGSVSVLNDPRLKDMKVLVIVDTPLDAAYLYEHIEEKPKLNLGGVQYREDRMQLDKSLYLSEKEINATESMIEQGVDVSFQQVPSETPKMFEDLVKNIKEKK